MQCEKVGDEALQGDKLDVLYGEADVAARERVQSHLELCPACRAELTALRGLRRDLAAWRLPEARQRRAPRGFVVPRWLAAAALFVLGFGATLGASGYVSLRRAVAEQQVRADALEVLQRESQRSLQAALGQVRVLRQPELHRVMEALHVGLGLGLLGIRQVAGDALGHEGGE